MYDHDYKLLHISRKWKIGSLQEYTALHSWRNISFKKNFLGEFRTSLEKAKVRANLGIADSETLLWGNIQGDISNQTDIAAYINTLLAFDFNVEKDFDPGNDFENVKNVRQAAITCL